jgi:predicted Zn-dependent protease
VDFLDVDVFTGRSYIGLEEYGKAKMIFDDLVSKHPDKSYLWYYLAVANEKSGYKGLSHYNLGRYHELNHDKDLTVFHYKKAVSLLSGENKTKAEKRLEDFLKKGKKKKSEKDKKEKENDEEKGLVFNESVSSF